MWYREPQKLVHQKGCCLVVIVPVGDVSFLQCFHTVGRVTGGASRLQPLKAGSSYTPGFSRGDVDQTGDEVSMV